MLSTTFWMATLALVCMLAAMLFILFDRKVNNRIPSLFSAIGAIFYVMFLADLNMAVRKELMFPLFAFVFFAFVAHCKYKHMKKAMVKEKIDGFKRECIEARTGIQVI